MDDQLIERLDWVEEGLKEIAQAVSRNTIALQAINQTLQQIRDSK